MRLVERARVCQQKGEMQEARGEIGAAHANRRDGEAIREALSLLDRARLFVGAHEWVEFDGGHLACPRCECRKADGHWPGCGVETLLADLGPAPKEG